jgi:Uma2 family endonuclease
LGADRGPRRHDESANLGASEDRADFCDMLNRAFSEQNLDLYAYHEVAVRLPGLINFQPEPDVTVGPGSSGHELFVERFLLVAEVLSPSNTRVGIDFKLRRYQEAPDKLYSVVIEPRELRVEIWAKRGGWQLASLTRPDDRIEMPEFGLTARVADLYRGTPLDPKRA